ncbi:MAG: leucyl aminopeptidase [Candidatus Zixiibacteriota bacterium]|nr:MAG: leucyl aminopeptidase [candidate division Zixibacteria bacterium]
MKCGIAKEKVEEYSGDALISLQYEDGPLIKGKLAGVVDRARKKGGFKAEKNEIFQIFPCYEIKAERLILVGLGKKKKSTLEDIRKAAGIAVKAVQNQKRVAFLPIGNPKETIPVMVEGSILGNYRFDQLKSEKKEIMLGEISFFQDNIRISESRIDEAGILAEGTCIARDFANLPANLLTPRKLAEEAVRLGKKNNIKTTILNEPDLKRLKMGALLAVGQGSQNRPRLVVWEYNGGRKNSAPLVFVGKGVTFDSGGLSIKPVQGMEVMKGDMGGAAAVISMMPILGRLKPRINVVGITPLVENLPSGQAYRPGDVLTASNGKTIEVISTDAEGRLILSDALVYAGRYKPKYVIDIATLTGACMVALGIHIAGGIMGTDQRLVELLIAAGERSGERLWQLPLWDDYRPLLNTTSADMKNSGGKWGGAITAAKFLSEFAEDYRWAHIDMAGMDNQENDHPYQIKGMTGWGVRLLSRFALSQAGRK